MNVTFHTRTIPKDTYVLLGVRYANNRLGLMLYSKDGEPWACLTLNIPRAPLSQDEVIVKNYSENEGVYDQLIGLGLVNEANRWIHSGFVLCPICELTALGKTIQDDTPLMRTRGRDE